MTFDFNFVNNVLFNWRHRSVDGGDQNSLINMINNYYKPGPATPDAAVRYRIVQPMQSWSKADPVSKWGKVYASGNVVEGNDKVTADNWDGGVQFEMAPDMAPDGKIANGPIKDLEKVKEVIAKVRSDQPFPMPPVNIQSAKDAYASVLDNAGATLPKRDPVDVRMINEVRTGKVWGEGKSIPIEPMKDLAKNNIGIAGDGIITDIKQVGGYPDYKGEPYVDSDHDGIPDAWEKAHGLNPNDPSDATKDLNGDGYTNIEKYINGLDPRRRSTGKIQRTTSATWADHNSPPRQSKRGTVRRITTAIMIAALLLVGTTHAAPTTAPSGDADAKYTAMIEKRVSDILAILKIDDAGKREKVHDILIAQYRAQRLAGRTSGQAQGQIPHLRPAAGDHRHAKAAAR